jgi:CHAT domain-containing protein/Tfp pilus assembly protein PilF
MGNYVAAEPLYKQALEIRRTVLGERHPAFAKSLNNLALLYYSTGEYAAAEPLFKQALEIKRAALGEQHPDFATGLNNLAALYDLIGDYVAAEPLYKQTLEITRATLGEQHPDFAQSLDNLAVLYHSMGNYAAAEPLCKQAMEIRRTVLGEQHPAFAQSLNNLAALYRLMGNYAAAEPFYKQAMEIRCAVPGEQHPDFAQSLDNLAELYRSMGNYAAAEPLCKQAIEICCAALGEQHPNFSTSLGNLALLYESMGNYSAAEPLYKQAMEIKRAALGEQHPDYAQSLDNLAGLYRLMGDYDAAELFYKQAMEIRRTVLGARHPDFATNLNNLAVLCSSKGGYAAAEPLCKQALEIYRAALGEQHPDFAASLNNLATLFAATNRETEAMKMMEQALAIDDRMIGQIFSISSENQRTAYLQTIRHRLDAFLSIVTKGLLASTEAVRFALSLVLRRKAIEAEALATQRDAVLGGRYPEVAPQLREITMMRTQIAQKALSGPGKEGLQTHQQLLVEWNAKKEKLEAELVHQVPEMNLEQKLRAADRQTVGLALPEGASLIEFVRFDVFDFKAVPARGESQWKPARYLAFVLPAREPDNLQMIDLGEAEPIDQMIATFRSAITDDPEIRGKRDLGALLSESVGEPNISNGTLLRAALFDPLLPAIGNRKRLLLAPDGDLTRLPFEALPTDDGRRLIDDYQVSYLGVGRDVLRFGATSSGQPAAALVAADPDFDLDAGQAHAQATSETAGALHNARRVSREIHTGDLEHLGRLPGTRVEGERIARMLGVKPLLGEEAMEARIKACRSPRILHLATHGFFLADQRRDPNQELRGLGLLGGQAGDGFAQMSEMPSERMSGPGMENPLLRSGVILAGFKTWLKGGSLPAEAEDGLLTAEDVSGLDLLATELVVLSACETGLGEVRTGEGVFGLRRAFVLAGAKTLVMSLWKVPDEATRELMEDFYRRILRGEPRAEALRQAQLEMKKKYPDPFYWGAFICQGEPGPLPSVGAGSDSL